MLRHFDSQMYDEIITWCNCFDLNYVNNKVFFWVSKNGQKIAKGAKSYFFKKTHLIPPPPTICGEGITLLLLLITFSFSFSEAKFCHGG